VPPLLIIIQEEQRSESLVQSKYRDEMEEHNQNCRFVDPLPLPFMSGVVHLAQPGLTAGRQTDEKQI